MRHAGGCTCIACENFRLRQQVSAFEEEVTLLWALLLKTREVPA